MSSAPLPTHLTPEQQAEDAALYRQVLHDFINIGADLARIVHTRAVAQAQADLQAPPSPDAPQPDPTIPFDRVARAVRRCILLARSLAKPPPPAPDPAAHRAAARRRILREVEDAIHRTPANDAPGTLAAELRERLDAPDLDDDLAARPIPEIIAEICRDLGLAAQPGADPWKRRTPADVAALNARAAAPTSAHQPGPNPHEGGQADAPACSVPRRAGPTLVPCSGPTYPGPSVASPAIMAGAARSSAMHPAWRQPSPPD